MNSSTMDGRTMKKVLKHALAALKEIAIVVVVALVLSALIRTLLVQAFYVPSASMEDTLLINDRIIASKITTQVAGVHRGDIVVFKDPGEWLAPTEVNNGPIRSFLMWVGLLPSNSGDDLVKRVIGVGGDRVVCCDAQGHISVNGKALDSEPYVRPGEVTDQIRFDVVVPDKHIFVMGDNRGNSEDSRFHLDANNGSVPVENVVGRVVLRIWPLDRFSPLTRPDSFDAIPAP